MLDDAVVQTVGERTGLYFARVEQQRRDGDWAFGVAMQSPKPGDYPRAWLFLAVLEKDGWTVALDSTSPFARLSARAPESV
ncbi:hypothetical protein, partial [Salmonella sp. SAL4432]|uniref:hypothetical protein n=1 Tax=Salmonella sp. SAL4432 TaxID=3159887 RepID=UPI00397A57D6